MSKKGEGVGRKGTNAHEQGAIVQFDWLVARQSNNDMKNLTLAHKPHPEYKKQNQKYN